MTYFELEKNIHSAMKLQRTIFLVRHQISYGIIGTKLTMRKKTVIKE